MSKIMNVWVCALIFIFGVLMGMIFVVRVIPVVGHPRNLVVNTPDGLAVVQSREINMVYTVNLIDVKTGKISDKSTEYTNNKIKEFNLLKEEE